MELLQAFILGLVEGITEFIPVSSTGHLILANRIVGFEGNRADTFDVFIQLGAILAVVVLYRQRFTNLVDIRKKQGFAGINGLILLAIACLPAFVLGFLGHDFIKEKLFNPITVAIGLGVGGVAILVVEYLVKPKAQVTELDKLTRKDALWVGLAQCLALWPGTSRSASTIIGGMLAGVGRKTAAEFSFFIAVPIMIAATGYDLLKSLKFLTASDIPVFAVGFVTAFFAALIAVRFFIRLLSNTTLIPFGWYRIVVAIVVIAVNVISPAK